MMIAELFLALLVLLVLLLVQCSSSTDHFSLPADRPGSLGTMYSREPATRPYDNPYTGTEPVGYWGATSWGETALSMIPTLCE